MSVLPTGLPSATFQELQRVYADPLRFFRLLKVWDKAARKYIPFVLNEEQELLLEALLAHTLVLVLKPRSIGVSTLLRAFAFWQCFTSDNPVRWATLSLTRDSANNLQRMDRGFLASLPLALTKHRKLGTDKASEIVFGDTGASTATFVTGKNGTRSYSLSDAHLSEFAFLADPDEVLASVVGTIGEGRIVIETTPNVQGDAYHRLVLGALDGSNGWHLVSFWWWQHKAYRVQVPEVFVLTDEEQQLKDRYSLDLEQVAWRRSKVNTLGLRKFRREFPACMQDAFAFLEGGYFSEDEVGHLQGLRFPTTEMQLEAPVPGEMYVLGCDVGGGVGQDYSAIHVLAASTRQVVWAWRSNTIAPAAFGDKIALIAGKYNNALVLVESNNHGHTTLQRLTDVRYTNLWVGQDRKPWTTTSQSKLAAYESLRELVSVLLHVPEVTLAELHALRASTLAPSAPDGQHDDLAMSLALASYALRAIPQAKILSTRFERVELMLAQVRASKRLRQSLPWQTST